MDPQQKLECFINRDVGYMLSLDYDNVTYDYILREARIIYQQFRISLTIFQSSINHFHIRAIYPLEKELAFKILKASRCSTDYKNFCIKEGLFPIRDGNKIIFHDGIETGNKPAPKQVFTITN